MRPRTEGERLRVGGATVDRTVEMMSLRDQLVCGALTLGDGREVKHTGDGFLASFT